MLGSCRTQIPFSVSASRHASATDARSAYFDSLLPRLKAGLLASFAAGFIAPCALDSAAVNGAAADTKPEVQAIVDAYNAIKANADNASATNPTDAQYAAIGAGIGAGTLGGLFGGLVLALAIMGAGAWLAMRLAAELFGQPAGSPPVFMRFLGCNPRHQHDVKEVLDQYQRNYWSKHDPKTVLDLVDRRRA